MNESLKEKIRSYVLGLEVDDVGFGAASEYKSPLSPKIETIFPGTKTLIVMAFKELSNCESDNKSIAMGGRIDIMEFMRSCSYKLSRYLERELKAKAMSTPLSYPMSMTPEMKFGLIADFSQRHAAIAAGLGNWGRHNLVIHHSLGSRVLFTTVYVIWNCRRTPLARGSFVLSAISVWKIAPEGRWMKREEPIR